jgi:hypothetical protein
VKNFKSTSALVQALQSPIGSIASGSVPLWGSIFDELESYGDEGWDGDGASAVAHGAISEAYSFINELPLGTLRPKVSVGYDGSIGFAWYAPEMTMFVHIPPQGSLDFTFDLVRHRLRYSKVLPPAGWNILEEIRPILGYIRPDPMVFIVSVTMEPQTTVTFPDPVPSPTPESLFGRALKMLNAGR